MSIKWFLVFLISLSIVSAENYGLRSIRFDEVAQAGTQHEFFIAVRSIDDSILEDVQVRLDSPELDIFALSDSVDINRNRQSSFIVVADIPYNAKGDYILRFTINDDQDRKRVYYRYITVA